MSSLFNLFKHRVRIVTVNQDHLILIIHPIIHYNNLTLLSIHYCDKLNKDPLYNIIFMIYKVILIIVSYTSFEPKQ